MKFENHKICEVLMISYEEFVQKNLRMFLTSGHVRCLENGSF
jgi:hypothetical protein